MCRTKMSFNEACYQTESFLAGRAFCLVVPRILDSGNGNLDSNVAPNKKATKTSFIDDKVVGLLHTIQHCVSSPWLGTESSNAVGAEQRRGFTNRNLDHEQCVSQYVEPILSIAGSLLAWRFHYVLNDPAFTVEGALKDEWLRKKEPKKRGAPKEALSKPAYRMPKNKEEHFYNLQSSWFGDDLMDQDVEKEFDALGLDEGSPAQLTRFLTYARSCKILERHYGNRVNPIYTNHHNHGPFVPAPPAEPPAGDQPAVGEDDELREEDENDPPPKPVAQAISENWMIRFPARAHLLRTRFMSPDVFFTANLNPSPPDVNVANARREALDNALAPNAGNTRANAKTVWLKLQKQHGDYTARRHPEMWAVLENLFAYDEFNPGATARNTWFVEQRRRPDFECVTTTRKPPLDARLSSFGNFVARQMYEIELNVGVGVWHKLIFMVMLISLAQSDVDHESLRLHLIMYGPKASGKSFVLEMAAKLSVPDSVDVVNVQTKRANTTSQVVSGRMVLIDELHELVTERGDSGVGAADVKTMLSCGKVKTQQCHVGEDGEREMQETESLIKRSFISCTNIPLSFLPETVADRWHRVPVPYVEREGYDVELASRQIERSEDRTKSFELFRRDWHWRQVLADRLWAIITSGVCPRPDITLVDELMSEIFTRLKVNSGINVETRNRARIKLMATNIVVCYAIEKVFFSGDVIPPGTPYQEIQLLKCIPYLTATREMAYMALTMMDSSVSDPCLPIIIKAISKAMADMSADEKFITDGATGKTDYNYYCISVTGSMVGMDMMPALTAKINAMVTMHMGAKLSDEIVGDIIKWMLLQTVVAKECHAPLATAAAPAAAATTSALMRRIATAKQQKTGTKYGLLISRHFIEDIAANASSSLHRAIQDTFDDSMKENQVFITGLTYGAGHPTKHIGHTFPFLMQTISTAETKERIPLAVHADNPVRTFQYAMQGLEARDITAKRIKMVEELDDYYRKKWLLRCKEAMPEEVDPLPGLGVYPDDFMEGYVKEVTGHLPPPTPPAASVEPPAATAAKDVDVHREEEEEDPNHMEVTL